MEQGSLNNLNKLSLNKNVFKQRGGVFGIILLAGLFLLVAFNLQAILAWANNLFKLVVVVVSTAIIIFIVADKKTRQAVSAFYTILITKVLSWIIKVDPISILKDTIRKMYRKIADLEDAMGKLNGIRLGFKEKIKEKKKAVQTQIDKVKAAESLGKTDLAKVEARQIDRLAELVKDYMGYYENTEKWYNSMSKLAEVAKLTVMDAENEVTATEEKYNAIKTANSAFKSAMSVLNGNPDELAMYNQAFTYVNDDMLAKIGEMDRIINSSGGMIDKIDLDKEVFGIKGIDLIKKYDELGIDALFTRFEETPGKQISSLVSGKPGPYADNDANVIQKSKSKYFG
jgi:predicted  nucleic acid-binding Zn-ribbon protein